MRLARVELVESPRSPGQPRLVGELRYADPARRPETIWFEVAAEHADWLSRSGNPWLAALLPLAVTLGEPIELCRPVDPHLRQGAEALMRVWGGWYPDRWGPVPIEADLAPTPPSPVRRTAAFFSGGVDSFHTLLRHQPGGDALVPESIEVLVTVWGFDVPLEAAEAFSGVTDIVRRAAAATGTGVVTIATNLRESGWREANWGLLGQGPALAAVAHALEGGVTDMLVPSSLGYHVVRPWGTHPLTDPLLSSGALAIRDDGALCNRREKITRIVESELAMELLRVCWIEGSHRNCGRCEKCLRTLTMLELLGKRKRATSFPEDAWSLDALAGLRYRNTLDRRYMGRLAEHATSMGRADIATAIGRAVRRYDRRMGMIRWARRLGWRPPEVVAS